MSAGKFSLRKRIWDRDMQKALKNSLNGIRKALLARAKELEKSRQLK